MPPFDVPAKQENRPTVSNVIDKIECEIAEARDDPANNDPAFLKYLNETLNIASFDQWGSSVMDAPGLAASLPYRL
jgi:hypothetical protein